MNTIENLESLSVSKLVNRFELDIRFGCHSTLLEASRSLAGKELERRAKTNEREAVFLELTLRLRRKENQQLDPLESSVRDGLKMLFGWI